jgi:hypothetical protein
MVYLLGPSNELLHGLTLLGVLLLPRFFLSKQFLDVLALFILDAVRKVLLEVLLYIKVVHLGILFAIALHSGESSRRRKIEGISRLGNSEIT